MGKGNKKRLSKVKVPALKELGLEEEDPDLIFDVHGKKGTGAFGYVST